MDSEKEIIKEYYKNFELPSNGKDWEDSELFSIRRAYKVLFGEVPTIMYVKDADSDLGKYFRLLLAAIKKGKPVDVFDDKKGEIFY